mmetsp:Transcript_10713/g.25409  ORF Transcript_10713/g.25409 Transcript_10713/m.25409 type:complete len:133 (-) Transcript_10713:3597-3995(-)
MIWPLFITAMTWARRIVDSRWATMIVVRPCMSFSRASATSCSLSVSRALVASSRRSTDGSFRTARAIAMRCFWPPERFVPRSPTSVSNPSGRLRMNSAALASVAASSTSSLVALGRPSLMFSLTVMAKSVGS